MSILIRDINTLMLETQELIKLAKTVSDTAYNRYSGFFVGAAIRSNIGKIYTGSFLENVSLGLTICAETAAATAANTDGVRKFIEVAIVGGRPGSQQVITPCGRCRQVLYEFACIGDNDFPVYCSDYDLNQILLSSISELLPEPYGPNQLLK